MSLCFGMRFMYLGGSHEMLCHCVIASITKYTHLCLPVHLGRPVRAVSFALAEQYFHEQITFNTFAVLAQYRQDIKNSAVLVQECV